MNYFWRFLPLMIIVVLMVLAYALGLQNYFTYDTLRQYRLSLLDLVSEHPFLSPILFMAVYMASTALSIPGGTILSIFGGFLFPQPLSTLYVVIAATLGAMTIFLAAGTAFGEMMAQKAGPRIDKMRAGFQENAANYLLFLRLVPLFPFWLVNVAPAFFGVRLWTFAWTTFLGIIPGAFVYTQAGVGLGAILDSGEPLSLDTIFNVQVKIALAALALFALLPVIVKTLKKRRRNHD
ncbi:MAG: TVP38/TMEM64 family protein [Waddliaceae bacterium]